MELCRTLSIVLYGADGPWMSHRPPQMLMVFTMITSLSSIFTAELPAYDRYQKMRKGQKQQQQYYLSLKLDFSRRIIKAKPSSHQKKTTVI